MAKPDVWMPLYVADYLADTSHLKLAEHGAYFLLIIAYWRGQKPLPNDDERLCRIVGLSKREWLKLRPILQNFFQISDRFWSHKKIDFLIAEAQQNSDRNSERARKAAEKRWNDDATSIAPSNAPSNARAYPQAMLQGMLDECSSPSPTSLKEEKKETTNVVSKEKAVRGTRLPEGWEPPPDVMEWAHRECRSAARELVKFRNYWQSKSGAQATKLDWSKTFHNWILTAADNDRKSPGGKSGDPFVENYKRNYSHE